jgi:probable HAF family extracellular repeat protein
MLGLGSFGAGGFSSEAFGVSADGSVVVGRSNSAHGSEAFVWTAPQR